MNYIIAILCLLGGLAISHYMVYRWGKNALRGELKASRERNEQLIRDKAQRDDTINTLRKQLYDARNLLSGDTNPADKL